jgi:hypothetical protein
VKGSSDELEGCALTYAISPNFAREKLDNATYEDFVDVFEDRILHWLIRPIALCLKDRQSRLAAFHLSLSYFEAIASHLEGDSSRHRSKKLFVRGFCDVFSSMKLEPDDPQRPIEHDIAEELAEVIYEDARCGLAHEAMFRSRVIVAKLGAPFYCILSEDGTVLHRIFVDIDCFIRDIEKHFKKYIEVLRDREDTVRCDNFYSVQKAKLPKEILELTPKLLDLLSR